jgi:hypothetical protein
MSNWYKVTLALGNFKQTQISILKTYFMSTFLFIAAVILAFIWSLKNKEQQIRLPSRTSILPIILKFY